MTGLGELWSALSEEQADVAGDLRRRLPSSPSFDLFLTHSRPSGHLGFLAAFDEKPGTVWRQLHGSAGLGVSVDAQLPRPSVQLTAKDSRYNSILEALVEDLLHGLDVLGAQPPQQAPLAMDFVAGRILRWQSCLRAESEGLSGEKRAGLVGELTALQALLATGRDRLAVVTGWTGPSQALQDFQLPGLTLEVKASRQTQPTAVRISSERQLDTSSLDRLLLVHVALDERGIGTGETLPRVVAKARDAVGRDSDAGLRLDDRLLEYGYLDLHADRYGDVSYGIRNVDWFDVRGDFPRLVEADLPVGVGDVGYALALSACEDYRLGEAQVQDLLKGTAP